MKLLIFDTETTGLPKTRNPAQDGPNNWPHIVSISWVIFNTDTNTIEKQENHIISPLNWVIPPDSTAIHGITNEYAKVHGEHLSDIIQKFQNETYDAIVAHNIEFDMNVIVNAALWDLKTMLREFPKRFCTMRLSRDLCKIEGNWAYKLPKLKELYFCAFGKMPDESQLHGSMYDVLILTEVIKHYLPLRQAMGLVASSVTTHGLRALHFNLS
jgi:DNA polymerase-3 subunit alpha